MNKLFMTTFAASLLLFASSNAGAQPARARASDTAIRGEKNLDSAIIATMKEGDLVHVVDLQGDWYRVIVPNDQPNPRTGFVPAQLIEIISVQELPQSPQFLMGPAIRVPAPPVAQGPMIPPTLAYIMQHRAEAAEHERALQALALERDNALEREQHDRPQCLQSSRIGERLGATAFVRQLVLIADVWPRRRFLLSRIRTRTHIDPR